MKILLYFLFTALMVGAAGCGESKSTDSKIVVVFVDVSASVKEYEVYRDAWSKILSRLEGGDRLVLARITDETFTRFRPVVDETLPKFNWLLDNKLRHEARVKKVREKVAGALDDVLKSARSPKTDILNTLVLAEKIFHGEKRRRVLVLLSDMLEDSAAYNFEQIRVNPAFTQRVIEEKRRRGDLPNLSGARIYVGGASAKSADRALEIQKFWLEYIKAANGNLAPQNYGPALINFEE